MRNRIFLTLVAIIAVAPSGSLSAQNSPLDCLNYLTQDDATGGIDIAVDSNSCIYVTGHTACSVFPVTNPYQASFSGGTEDVFVAKFSSSGSALVFCTYLGGSGADGGMGISLDSNRSPYIAGYTESLNFPVRNAYQPNSGGGSDAFVSKLSPDGSAIIFSTYLGGEDDDNASAVALDSNLGVYVSGMTTSYHFPTVNPYQAGYESAGLCPGDAFVSKFASSGTSLIYSTYLGGYDQDYAGNEMAVDESNCAYITGKTASFDFPTKNSYQPAMALSILVADAFLAKFTPSGSDLVYSTYLGGTLLDYGWGTTVDSDGCAYVTGETASIDFPVLNAYQASLGGGLGSVDAFVAKFSDSGSRLIYSTYLGGSDGVQGAAGITLDLEKCAYVTGSTTSSDFPCKNAYQSIYAGGGDIYGDVFVTKLAASGATLVASTYLGGEGEELGTAVTLDSEKNVYVTGQTGSLAFPTAIPYQAGKGGTEDAFITKLFPSMDSLLYSTYFGRGAAPPEAPQYTILESGDYNGDGTSDIAVFRGSSGMWSVRNLTRIYFGNSTDYLVPADYNGDGTTDVAIFRDSSGMWSVRNLSRFYLGISGDVPVPGDYIGNGTAAAGLFRASGGLWAIRNVTRAYFGSTGDSVVPGYYDLDDVKDIAIFRGSSGMWSVRNVTRFYFGSASDYLVPGDYNGAGKWEGGIFRPSTGMWSIRNVTRFYLGNATDQPVPADYNGNGADDAGIFRDSSGMWAVRNLSRVYFGSTDDVPVTR